MFFKNKIQISSCRVSLKKFHFFFFVLNFIIFLTITIFLGALINHFQTKFRFYSMSSLYGVGLDLSVSEIQKQLKVHIMKHGGGFIEKLQKIFEMFDLNGNGKLDLMEFEKGLNKFGFFPKKVEVQALLKYYDTNNDNMIDFKEFCQALRQKYKK